MARYNQPVAPHPDAANFVVTAFTELAELRRFITQQANRYGLSADRGADLRIIATELATNSLQHTDDACRLTLWRHDDALICQTSDRGHLDDPLAGRRPPNPGVVGGRGLWTVNALSDVFHIRTTPAGTTIQTHLGLNIR